MNFDDIFDDPELKTEFMLTRTTESVNVNGRAEFLPTDIPLKGVILPATEKQMERLPEEHRNSEIMAIYCAYQITSGSETLAADVVTHRGESYEVISVKDWMQLAGYCEGLAKSTSVMGREIGE